jgi:hypothetical protein
LSGFRYFAVTRVALQRTHLEDMTMPWPQIDVQTAVTYLVPVPFVGISR